MFSWAIPRFFAIKHLPNFVKFRKFKISKTSLHFLQFCLFILFSIMRYIRSKYPNRLLRPLESEEFFLHPLQGPSHKALVFDGLSLKPERSVTKLV